MTIFGISLILIFGIINFILILMQLLSGMKIIKFRIGVHKAFGGTLVVTSILHALLAVYLR